MTTAQESTPLTRKDFVAPVDVRWCPSCGDYAILSAAQKVFPELGIPRENFVIVSGIGCSSRFPYYTNTYGFHSIHGRAPAVATGVKLANPDLSVWIITGDGDGLSIGAHHLMHILRRNVNVNILLFNNRVYGLTKGQYSPTTEFGKKTKTTPMGSSDTPINPLAFALASGASFIARTVDTNPKHMSEVFKQAAEHKGTSFVEIFQNCVIYNNNTFEAVVGREHREEQLLVLEDGAPLLYGKARDKGLRLKGLEFEKVQCGTDPEQHGVMLHDSTKGNVAYAQLLAALQYPDFPTPIGVLHRQERAIYDEELQKQIDRSVEEKGPGDLEKLLWGQDSWVVK